MRVRHGFVSNSSSTAFIVTNTTDAKLTLVDFVRENPQLIEEYIEQYVWDTDKNKDEFTQENLLASAESENEDISPGDNPVVTFKITFKHPETGEMTTIEVRAQWTNDDTSEETVLLEERLIQARDDITREVGELPQLTASGASELPGLSSPQQELEPMDFSPNVKGTVAAASA